MCIHRMISTCMSQDSSMASHPHQTHAHHKTSHTIVAPASDCIIRDGCFVSCWHSQSPSTDLRTCRTYCTCLHCCWTLHDHFRHFCLSLNDHTRRSSVLVACTRDQQSCAWHLSVWRHCSFMLPFVWFHPLAEVFIYGIANVRLLTSSIVFLVCAIDDDGASKFMGGNT